MPNHAPMSTVQQFNRCQSMPQHSSKQSHCTNFTGTMCDSQHKLNWNTCQTMLQNLASYQNICQTMLQCSPEPSLLKFSIPPGPHTLHGLCCHNWIWVFFSSEVVSFAGGFPTSTARWQFPGCLSDGMNRLYPISGGCQILRQYAVFMNVGRLPKCGVNPVHGNIWRQENNQCTTTKRLSSVFHRIILGVFLFQVIKDRT